MFYKTSLAGTVAGLAFSAAFAAPPAPKIGAKVPNKTVAPATRSISGLVGINRQLVYSDSSTFSQSRRVMRTERSNVLRGGTSSLRDSDRSEEARRVQRRTEQRLRAQQQRLRLQKR